MNIAILKESLCIGGTERSAANTAKILSAQHQVFVMLYDASQTKYSYGGELVDFALPARKSVLSKIANNFMRMYQYEKYIKKEKIQLLYEFISINNPISAIKHKNVARIISARDFSVLSKCAKRFYVCLQAADAMICNSEYTKNYYIAKYPEHKDKVFTVYNVIDGDEIARQAAEETEAEYLEFINRHNRTISVVGRFCKEKGFEFMLEALAKASETTDLGLVMVGDGSYKEKYDRLISDLNLQDRVYFTGFQGNPYKYMAKSDIFVLSSLSEGFPNVLAEAMSLGLPVIATNCYSGPAEILRDDQDYEAVTTHFKECDYGILTPRMTETDNKDAIRELAAALEHLASDEMLMDKYSKLSKQRATVYAPQAAMEKFQEIFEKSAGVTNDRNKR